MYKSQVSDVSAKYNEAVADCKTTNAMEALKKERDKLRKQVEEFESREEEFKLKEQVYKYNQAVANSKNAAMEALKNDCQKWRKQVEEFKLKEQVYSQQLNKTRAQHKVEISEINRRLTEQYEAKLQQSIQEMKDKHETEMTASRNRIVRLFENKIKNLTNQEPRNNASISIAVDERDRKIGELESANAALVIRARDLEKMLDVERQRHAEERAALEAELNKLHAEMDNQLQEFEDYQKELDEQIDICCNLVVSAKSILNPHPVQSSDIPDMPGTPVKQTPVYGGKRKRTTSEELSTSNYHLTSRAKLDVGDQ